MSHRRQSYRFGQTSAAKRKPTARKEGQTAEPGQQRKVLKGDQFSVRQRLKRQRRAQHITWIAVGLAVLGALLSYLFT